MTFWSEHDFIRSVIEEDWLCMFTQKETAKRLKISEAYLSDIINGRRRLSDNLLEKLGYERVSFIKKKGA